MCLVSKKGEFFGGHPHAPGRRRSLLHLPIRAWYLKRGIFSGNCVPGRRLRLLHLPICAWCLKKGVFRGTPPRPRQETQPPAPPYTCLVSKKGDIFRELCARQEAAPPAPPYMCLVSKKGSFSGDTPTPPAGDAASCTSPSSKCYRKRLQTFRLTIEG